MLRKESKILHNLAFVQLNQELDESIFANRHAPGSLQRLTGVGRGSVDEGRRSGALLVAAISAINNALCAMAGAIIIIHDVVIIIIICYLNINRLIRLLSL
jgi:hypothetical protein